MDKKKVLVIGGNSFVAKEFTISCASIFDISSLSRKQSLAKKEFLIDDLFDAPESIFKDVDVVINCAAVVHQPNMVDEGIYERVNFKLPVYLAQLAKKNGVKQFIQLSTIAVYGAVEYIDQSSKCSPDNNYGKYKLKADQALELLSDDNFIVTLLRPSMIYGGFSGAPGNMVSLIDLVKKNLPLPFKNIVNKRQFLNVNNLVNAMTGIIEKRIQGVVILADEEVVSIERLIELIYLVLPQKNKMFKSSLFWWVIKKIKPGLAQKLIGDLIIVNTYSFQELGVKDIATVKDGISQMTLRKNNL